MIVLKDTDLSLFLKRSLLWPKQQKSREVEHNHQLGSESELFGFLKSCVAKDFASVLRLRDEARQTILAGCGEPDLGELVKPLHPLRALFEAGDWQDADKSSQ